MGALISNCGQYRYWLTRDVQTKGYAGVLTYIMLNPSTADANQDDPTIRKCKGFALRNDFERFRVVNLFAFRATKPGDLGKAKDPIGPDNMKWVLDMSKSSDMVICAWGTYGTFGRQNEKVLKMLAENNIPVFALELTKDRHPKHPLYISYDKQPVRFP